MREILFRGVRLNGTEWLYGDFNLIEGKEYIFNRGKDSPLNSPDWYEVKPETVGQYTGMNDKNGNKIFEGDILQSKSSGGSNYRHVIRFEDGGYKAVFIDAFYAENTGSYLHQSWITEFEKEIIGNITDNPDLLTPNEKI